MVMNSANSFRPVRAAAAQSRNMPQIELDFHVRATDSPPTRRGSNDSLGSSGRLYTNPIPKGFTVDFARAPKSMESQRVAPQPRRDINMTHQLATMRRLRQLLHAEWTTRSQPQALSFEMRRSILRWIILEAHRFQRKHHSSALQLRCEGKRQERQVAFNLAKVDIDPNATANRGGLLPHTLETLLNDIDMLVSSPEGNGYEVALKSILELPLWVIQ